MENFIHMQNPKLSMKSLAYSINRKVISSVFLAMAIQLSIVTIGLSQSTHAQADQAFKSYENPDFGLSLTYPPTCTVDELRNDPTAFSNNSIVASFKSPSQGKDDKYLENVVIVVQGPRSDITSLETYTENSIRDFTNMSDTIKITRHDNDTLAGLPAHQILYTSTGLPGLSLEKMQVFTVINNSTAYLVTFSAEAAGYDKNIKDVEKMINSIKIDKDAMENLQDNQED